MPEVNDCGLPIFHMKIVVGFTMEIPAFIRPKTNEQFKIFILFLLFLLQELDDCIQICCKYFGDSG